MVNELAPSRDIGFLGSGQLFDRVFGYSFGLSNGSGLENGAQSVTAGVNWYANSRTRMMFNWSQYWYETQLGTPYSCNQQSCSAANLRGRGNSNWEIQTRLQLWF